MAAPKPDESTLFNAARRIDDPAARRLYVREACGDDLALAARGEALLRAHDEDPFLALPDQGAWRGPRRPERGAHAGPWQRGAVEALRQGEHPSVEAFAQRYAGHADDIRDMLPALELMEQAKSTEDTPGRRQAEAAPLRQPRDCQTLREVGPSGRGRVSSDRQRKEQLRAPVRHTNGTSLTAYSRASAFNRACFFSDSTTHA